ncbi:beta-propeller fold lactonase family protein [Litoreibacter roseus]|uniref:Lactonase, 7-bladed beta-propeller n=1 Tax=Litoreibacter roseus TaxID=2601869 RepID=A0A6N6JLK7_9RHOB|nr:beta-propeller fold lactonase family protein [Litoreibacter roseus]GFE67004.1 hypothetical protein KIN_40780 [Litoreibacter roseus]
MRNALAAVISLVLLSSPAVAEPAARYVLGLSDLDMAGTAYEDGQLGVPLDAKDTLLVFDTSQPDRPLGLIDAPNSVFSPPEVMDISPDGTRAVVVETLQQRRDGQTKLAELEENPGTALRLYDLSDPAQLKLIAETEVPARPQAVSFNAAGDMVAVVGLTSDNGLTLVEVDEGFGTPQTFSLNLTDRGDIPFDLAHNVQFHPTEDILAVNLTLRNQVVFYRVGRDDAGGPNGITQWGNLVATNKFPMGGLFTPNGRHYITSDLMWGADVQRFYGIVGQGTLTSIRVAEPDAAEPAHFIQGIQTGGFQAETLAISPDGSMIATSNLRTTGLPQDNALFDAAASVSLYALDAETGGMTLIEEEFFDAHLPQGLAFDPGGDHLYVGVNEYFDATDPVTRAGIELWEVSTEGLDRTSIRMPAPRGVHVVRVIE